MRNKIIVTILSLFIAIDVLLIYFALSITPIKLKRNVFVYEYGEDISVDVADYVNGNPTVLENVMLNLSGVSKEVGTYKASIEYFGEVQEFEIQVVDTIKPKAKLKNVEIPIQLGDTVYAKDLLEEIDDASNTYVYFFDEDTNEKVKSITYTKEGSYIERIVVVDDYGNQSASLRVKIVVSKNAVAPTLTGVNDITLKVGEDIDLRKGVYAKDDIEGDITSRIKIEGTYDNQLPGVYQIVYTVSDSAGNIAKEVRKVTIEE